MIKIGRRVKGFIFGVCICLLLISIVLFSAGVSRWSQYSLNGYTLGAGRVRSSFVFNCSSVSFIPVYEVEVGGNATCMGVTAFMGSSAASFDDALAMIAGVGTAPQPMYLPADCQGFALPPPDAPCSWNQVNFPSPAYAQVFCMPASAQADRSYWLGIWIAFLVLFCLSAPVVIYGMAINCSTPDDEASFI